MPNNLNRRVARLEKDGHGKKRFLVVVRHKGESQESAITRSGLEPADDDTILFITQISRSPGDDLPNGNGGTECRET